MRYVIKKKYMDNTKTSFFYEVVIWLPNREILVIFETPSKPKIEEQDLIVETKDNCHSYYNLYYGDTVEFLEE